MNSGRIRLLLCITSFLFVLFSLPSFSADEKLPLTVAESSDYKATSRHSDILEFIGDLQAQSALIRVETLCTSAEGRKVPLLVIGNPVPASPADLNYDGRMAVYFQANIHAGEVEGKEACLMLARDLLLKNLLSRFENLVILIAPIFNADGNEKISQRNRTRQKGPEDGVGVRHNGQNLDLNRDGMKMESPEMKGLVSKVLNRWDPVLILDSHTHNGSYHAEPVTYTWNLNPNGEPSIINYLSDRMMPSVGTILREKYNTLSVPHGDFMDVRNPEKGWQPLGPQPRYLSNYIGLRNRMALLNENYPYADYRTRVLGCYNLLLSILEYCSSHKEEMTELVGDADRETVKRGMNPSENDAFIVEYDVRALEKKYTIIGYEMKLESEREGGRPRLQVTDKEITYEIPYFADYYAKRSVRLPFGYIIQLNIPEVLSKLQEHGILVEKLTAPITLNVESFKINEITSAERLYQGHHLNSVKGEYVSEEKTFSEGALFIPMAQPLANVAAYLLEPESDDGLLVWNYFDRYIVQQWRREAQTYPVYRVLEPTHLVKETIHPK